MFSLQGKRLTRAGVIAGLYAVTTLITMPIASGAIQIRLSEALTLLPLLFPEAIPALFIGCFLSNLLSGCALLDVVFGSLITLVAGILTCLFGKVLKNTALKLVVGGAFPVLLNAFLLPVIWVYCYGALEYLYFMQATFLIIGQVISVYALGVPIYLQINKLKDKHIRFFE